MCENELERTYWIWETFRTLVNLGSDHDDLSLNGVIGNADKRIDQNQFYD